MRPEGTGKLALVAVLAALVAGVVGVYLGGHPGWMPDAVRGAFLSDTGAYATRTELLEQIKDDYYKKVDLAALEQSSLKGLVDGLDDRFSTYLTPDQARLLDEQVSGKFEGVGMSVREDKRGLRVARVFTGAPAAKAGIREDDLITRVNGESIAGETSELATAKIRGEPGTSVKLTVTRSEEQPRTLSIARAEVDIPVAESKLMTVDGTKLGVAQLTGFSMGASEALRKKIDAMLEKGAKGLVLDLRGNGGGLLSEAVAVASIFVERGEIVSTRGRTQEPRDYSAEGDAIAKDIPVVVLVDDGTASASEIVAGALRDRGRATLVGRKTFGKGVFGQPTDLPNGGEVVLTTGEYFLPDGDNIADKGLKPEVKAQDRESTDADEGLAKALDVLLAKLR